MAATMQVELVSPDKLLASVEAEKVMLPGTDGDFTAMPGHVPVVTSLSPGAIRIVNGADEHEYLIAGGFAEVSDAGISILAEFASLRGEATAEMFQSSLEAAEKALEGLEKDELAEATRRYSNLKTMVDTLGRAA
jgi:F-type H+-transporting ATPase subunit epsilon